ncbi:MAG: Nif3-like dinuclear metal center hexameric protein [Clostridia bacterium]|nr:Nif3-like dinuclear metal center hexameric protein [Clostridia bacterium]
MTNRTIYEFLDSKAPFATAEEWDNVGLLVGNANDEVRRIVVALDVTYGALETARAVGAELIVAHHPVIFSPLRQLEGNSLPYALAAAGIGVIAAHTNLDKAADGVNDTLAARLGLTEVRPTEDGMCRVGTLPEPTDAATFAKSVAAALGTAVRTNGGGQIKTVALCGGSGGDFLPSLADKADAFVTGEVRHHEWLWANAHDFAVIEAGHYATEVPVVDTLCRWLTEAFPTLTVTAYYDESPYTTLK